MSERERWIVYPLLFFALGAAVRDKLMQRIEAREVFCESLKIIDQQDPTKLLAELGFRRGSNTDPAQLADRVGSLRLIDSDGREVCELASDMLVQRLVARQLLVIDPNTRPLVLIGTEAVPGMAVGGGDAPVSYQGVIYLNNRPLGTGVRLAPPASRRPAPEADASPDEESPAPPAAGE